ncbi:diacylglycerol kinase [Virgibacillus profundi]|uniref:Diacylglycerol kinase n=1 Tax=Virgibacillus profundi TaxID=2024555 RepID=A0A2A2IHV8_9BACI|nr:YegS/Rv2252/BmrU family lipid kinase [Virgibacillus profundi]PAV30695.1 diacylglycerol kinase [Virgibacillus profundi]PXY54867.1 diacylglycerol kinase [Virgibacillus profundi]
MPIYSRGLFLYNGNLEKNDLDKKLARTLPILSQRVKELTVIQTATIEEAKNVCRGFADQIELLIILGGDGTVHECINSLATLENKPAIAILPGGTANDFSRMLHMPQNLQAAAHAIVEGDIVDIDLGKADDQYFLNFWGIGLVSETSKNIDDDQKKSLGVLSYFMSTLKTVGQAELFSYEIIADDMTYDGEAVMILVLNGKFLGTKELPIPKVSPTDGKLDVLIVKNSNLASFRELLSMNNPELDADGLTELTHLQVEAIKIKADKSKVIDMDGEMNGTTPSEITILPNHLQMIQAASVL